MRFVLRGEKHAVVRADVGTLDEQHHCESEERTDDCTSTSQCVEEVWMDRCDQCAPASDECECTDGRGWIQA